MRQREGAPIAVVGRREGPTVVHRAARDQHRHHDDDGDRPAPTDVSPSIRPQIAQCGSRRMKHPSPGRANTRMPSQIICPRCTVTATGARMRRKWYGDQRSPGRSTMAVSSNTKWPRSSMRRSASEPTRNPPLRGYNRCSFAMRSAHCVGISRRRQSTLVEQGEHQRGKILPAHQSRTAGEDVVQRLACQRPRRVVGGNISDLVLGQGRTHQLHLGRREERRIAFTAVEPRQLVLGHAQILDAGLASGLPCPCRETSRLARSRTPVMSARCAYARRSAGRSRKSPDPSSSGPTARGCGDA